MTGSLAKGVSRFSRLFIDHVLAEPDAVTIVPNRGLAMTFVQGIGVSFVAVQDDGVLASVVCEAADAIGEGHWRRFYRDQRSG